MPFYVSFTYKTYAGVYSYVIKSIMPVSVIAMCSIAFSSWVALRTIFLNPEAERTANHVTLMAVD